MGAYISNRRSNITNSTILTSSTNGSNSSSSHHSSTQRKQQTACPSNNFASYFYIAGKKFEILLDQCQPFLFGDKSDLSFIYTNKPIKYSYPSTNLNSVTQVLKCLMNIRKDSLKLTKCEDGGDTAMMRYNIEFRFDCDVDVKIEIYYFVKEKFSNGLLSYVTSVSNSPYYKSQSYKAGSNILFQCQQHVIIPSKYNSLNWQHDPMNHVYPIAILCTPVDTKLCTHSHVTYASLDKVNDSDNYTIKLLKQKQAIGGVCYSLQEIYGIEKKPVATSSSTNSETSIPNSKTSTSNSSNANSLSRKNSEKYSSKARRDSSVDLQQGVIECVICMCEKRDTLILPCRHLCLCKSCANNLRGQSNNCPICRVPFNALLQMEIIKSNQMYVRATGDVNETIVEEGQIVLTAADNSNLDMYISNDRTTDTLSSESQDFSSPLSSQENLRTDLQLHDLSHKTSNVSNISKKSFIKEFSIDLHNRHHAYNELDTEILWNDNNNSSNNTNNNHESSDDDDTNEREEEEESHETILN